MNLPCGCPSLEACTHPAIIDRARNDIRYARRWGVVEVDFEKVAIKVISLARRPDRLDDWRAEYSRAGLSNPVQVVEGVDGERLKPPARWSAGKGAYGCHLSHMRILIDAAMSGESVWIMEDDCVFRPGFLRLAREFWAKVSHDCDAVYFGGQHMRTPIAVKPGVVRCVSTHRTHSYLVTPAFARELIAAYDGSDDHIDKIAHLAQRGMKAYAPKPFLCGQGAAFSDICGADLTDERYW